MPIESSIESPTETGTAAEQSAVASRPEPRTGERAAAGHDAPASLVALCQELEDDKVVYCRWSARLGLEGDRAPEDDVQLLVSRAHMHRVTALLARLGFKRATARPQSAVPEALESYTYDPGADGLIRIRAQHHLLLGHELTRNYRLPIESQCLSSAAPRDGLFRAPAPEYELIVFVLQVLLRHSALDIVRGSASLARASERLAELRARVDPDRVHEITKRDLPFLGAGVFEDCLEALQPAASAWQQLKARLGLISRLRAYARRAPAIDTALRMWRGAALAVRERIVGRSAGRRLNTGGAIIAIVGGDGAGKSTVVDALGAWLSRDFATTSVHLGKPRWSWTTTTVRGTLKLGQYLGLYSGETSFRETLRRRSLVSMGYPWLLREVCRARDRWAIYVGARRFAAAGGLVVSDRFPLPQIQLMDGPQARRFLNELPDRRRGEAFLTPHRQDPLARALMELEERYYQHLVSPEVLIVLRVDPDIAVQRRTGEDLATVRERSTEIWHLDWQHTGARVIDAGKPKAEVLAQAKAFVWSQL